ncbi:uncharacterized protein LOC113552928 isoform X3 [Rhopalosiphum maidis]|uniref:uncharacterized protein LOC113552928 isoform X3 n=1 Tax=Rhopalosiphum maidis TaxID=43146 RepID=UPI000EFEE79B|nr:uncharacterized protein LOC113552928 isoform X3 [Rhopalosiphum maidis]
MEPINYDEETKDIVIQFFNYTKQQKCDEHDPPKSPYQYCSDLRFGSKSQNTQTTDDEVNYYTFLDNYFKRIQDVVAEDLAIKKWCENQFNAGFKIQ